MRAIEKIRNIARCENKFERLNFRSGSRIDLRADLKSILRHFSAWELKFCSRSSPVQVGVLERLTRTLPVHKSGQFRKVFTFRTIINREIFRILRLTPKFQNFQHFPTTLTPRGVFTFFVLSSHSLYFLYSSTVSLKPVQTSFFVMNF